MPLLICRLESLPTKNLLPGLEGGRLFFNDNQCILQLYRPQNKLFSLKGFLIIRAI